MKQDKLTIFFIVSILCFIIYYFKISLSNERIIDKEGSVELLDYDVIPSKVNNYENCLVLKNYNRAYRLEKNEKINQVKVIKYKDCIRKLYKNDDLLLYEGGACLDLNKIEIYNFGGKGSLVPYYNHCI